MWTPAIRGCPFSSNSVPGSPSNATPEGRQMNRRIDVNLIGLL